MVTHIRSVVEANGDVLSWRALCGVARPASSISLRMYAQVQRGEVQPFNDSAVTICPECEEQVKPA